ncbi:MAG: DNA polymerase III subunit gamma/tau [Elusimicrobiota bacterium]|nr:DNA polymerase III subunit gamma/tau [Elusimicrobiota bacterium]
MSHLVIARKYRPAKFSEIIGQGQVTVTLGNAIVKEKLAHAYVFSGPRGVGKTTAARILAKAVNCAEYPSAEPCNKCDSCKAIQAGSSMDIIEIDAASNRGIEDMRELRENAAFAPSSSRFKVYVIDEAHQITPPAFNAFLKTLEEPPPYIIFVLATTEPEKLPVTILSRCQHFKFSLVNSDDVKGVLRKICVSEKVLVSDGALDAMCEEAAGSIRDAESILEQVISSAQGRQIERENVEFILGLVASAKIKETLVAISLKDTKAAFALIGDIYSKGFSLQQFVRQLITAFRGILADVLSGNPAGGFKNPDRVYWMLESLCAAEQKMKWSEYPKILLELAFYKITSDFIPIDEVISLAESGNEERLPPETVRSAGRAEIDSSRPAAKIGKRPQRSSGEAASPATSSADRAVVLTDLLKRECGAAGKLFEFADEIRVDGSKLCCLFSGEKEAQAKRLLANSEIMEEALASHGHKGVTIDVTIVMPEKTENVSPEKKITEARQLEMEEPVIANMHKLAGGALEGREDE